MRMLRLGLGRVDSPDIDGRARYLAVMQHPFAGLQGWSTLSFSSMRRSGRYANRRWSEAHHQRHYKDRLSLS